MWSDRHGWPTQPGTGAEQQPPVRRKRAEGNGGDRREAGRRAALEHPHRPARRGNRASDGNFGSPNEHRPNRNGGEMRGNHHRRQMRPMMMPGRHRQRDMANRLPQRQQHHHIGNSVPSPPHADHHTDHSAGGNQQRDRRPTRINNTPTNGMRRNAHRPGRGPNESATHPRHRRHRHPHRPILLPVVAPPAPVSRKRPPVAPRVAHHRARYSTFAAAMCHSWRTLAGASRGERWPVPVVLQRTVRLNGFD